MSADGQTSEVRLGQEVPERYCLSLQAKWESEVGDLRVGLICNQSQGEVIFKSHSAGYEEVGPTFVRRANEVPEFSPSFWGQDFKSGNVAELFFVVAPDRIEVFANDEQLGSWKIDFQRLRAPNP